MDPSPSKPQVPKWGLYVDGSSNDGGSGAGLILVSPEGHRIHCALKFGFKASNHEAKYEALRAGLELAKEMKVELLDIFSDSQLFVCQINNEYQAREEKMAAYLQKAKELLGSFSSYTISQILRSQNAEVDALARLTSGMDVGQLKFIPVETLNSLSIQTEEPITVNSAVAKDSWMTPVILYLKDGVLPKDKKKARLLRLKAARCTLYAIRQSTLQERILNPTPKVCRP